MAVDGFGSAADHAALSGLEVGDPHTQYAYTAQGLAAARPVQPVRAGTRYYSTDTGVESMSDGSAWHDLAPQHTHPYAPSIPAGSEYVTHITPGANLDATKLPWSWPVGVSHGRGQGAGWPGEGAWVGNVRTIVQSNQLDVTQVWEGAHANHSIYYRRADGLSNTWGVWQLVHSPDSGWIELTGWLNGATAYSTGLGNAWTPRYRKVGGIVHLAGLFNTNATTAGLHVNTLPAGYRPGTGVSMFQIGHTGSGIRRMDVASDGSMRLHEQFAGAATTGWHNLTLVQFVAEA